MSENTTAENTPVATTDETTLSGTQKDMLAIMRASAEKMAAILPKKEKRTLQDVLVSLVLDGTDEDVKGLEKFRAILTEKATEVFNSEQGSDAEISEDEKGKIRKEAKMAYESAANVLGMFPLPEGFVVPTLPGSRAGSAGSGAGGEKPRNLKHVLRDGAGNVVAGTESGVTFAVIANKTKESTADLLAQFKSVAGENKEAWENGPGTWEWSFKAGEGENATEYSVTTKYDAPK